MLELRSRGIIDLHVNGTMKTTAVRAADTLLSVLREQLGLTGTKNGCENGDCDGCTVLLDGWPVKSCQMLAVEAIGHEITTIEGLIDTPIQQAFAERFAIQCGYCTPGMIMNCQGLINNFPNASDEEVEEWLESNLCRCTGYQEIRDAVTSVLRQQRSQ